ncbi:MAG: EAL domain-containing protein [Terriglobia bacterium]
MGTTLLDAILEPGSLTPMFQPIFDLGGMGLRLHSFECLTRGPRGTSAESAPVMFEYVRRKREEISVDRACVQTAMRAAALLPSEPCISINVHVRTLVRDRSFVQDLKRMAEESSIAPGRLTIELNEHVYPCDVQGLWRALEEIKTAGMRLALDDVGSGQSNYSLILDCQPDALKVDAYPVQGCHADKHRVAALESIVALARTFDSQVIAEGIEEMADLDTVLGLGIGFGQGFILAKPMTVQNLLEGSRSYVVPMASGRA